MAETIEDIAKAAPAHGKNEGEKPKQISVFGSAASEFLQMVKTVTQLGIAAVIPAAQATIAPQLARDTAIMASAQVAADATTNYKRGKKTTAREILNSSAVGTLITAPVFYAYNIVNKIPTDTVLGYVSKGAAWGGAAIPVILGIYQSIDYLVRTLSFKGLGKYLKENYWPTLKYASTRLLPFSLANIFFVPPILQIPVGAVLSYIFALFGAPKKGELKAEEKRDPTPFYVAAGNAFGRGLKNIFYGVPQAIYAVGSTLYGKLAKPVAPLKPAAAGAKA